MPQRRPCRRHLCGRRWVTTAMMMAIGVSPLTTTTTTTSCPNGQQNHPPFCFPNINNDDDNKKHYFAVEAFRSTTTTTFSIRKLQQCFRPATGRIVTSRSLRKMSVNNDDDVENDQDENTNHDPSSSYLNQRSIKCRLNHKRHPFFRTTTETTTNSSSATNPNLLGSAVVGLLFGLFLCAPLPAWAGFGPSGGATTSPTPGLSKINVQVQDLNKRKLEQVIGSTIDETRLNELQAQIDALIESIVNNNNNNADTSETTKTTDEADDNVVTKIIKDNLFQTSTAEEQQQELEKAKLFQAQILRREKLLDALEAQPWWFNYFAAFCGSVVSTLIMHPVDTIKTRLQVKPSFEDDEDENDDKTTAPKSKNDPGFFDNLYEGLGGNILKEGPPSALYLGVYESVKASLLHGKLATTWAGLMGMSSTGAAAAVLGSSTGGSPAYLLSIYLMSGAAGELIGSTIRAPAETVKTMVQTQTAKTLPQAFDLALKRPEGRRNVVRAWSSSALRDIPFGALQLALFELIKAAILNNPDIDFDSSTLQSEAIIGAVAASVGAFVTNPLDVVATRIISQPTTGENGQEPLGLVGMAKTIHQEGGMGAFFSGWQARVLYWGPAISLFLTCYCSIRQLGIQFDLFN